MGCGCGSKLNTESGVVSQKENTVDLTGKMILDKSGKELLVLSPIFDAYKDIIGYTVKTLEQTTLRIFSKDVEKILD